MLAACEHTQPYEVGNGAPPDNAPITIGAIQQLTFDPTGDFAPAWLPGDSLFAFSWQVPGRADGDRCLAIYAALAARIRRLVCSGGDVAGTTSNQVLCSAISPGGRLAFVAQTGRPGFPLIGGALYVKGPDDTAPAVAVLTLPFATDSSAPVTDIEQLAWRDDSTLVFLAVVMQPTTSDLESRPEALEVLRLSGGTAIRSELPNSITTTSVAVDPADGLAYVTLVGDSSIYRVDLATGQRTRVRGMGAMGVPRDIKVSGHRLVALFGGKPYTFLPSGDSILVDQGGNLLWASVDDTLPPTVVTGAEVVAHPPQTGGADRWFRHLALSRDGKLLVAEGYPVSYVLVPPTPPVVLDTVITKLSDLFLVRLP